MNSRLLGLPRALLLTAGATAWGAYRLRLLRRSLQMLQLESYQTARFLCWWMSRPARLTPPLQAGGVLGGLLAGGLLGSGSGPRNVFASLVWALGGLILARLARFPAAKKPLVMTARARRLAAAAAVVDLALAAFIAYGQGLGRKTAPTPVEASGLAPPARRPAQRLGWLFASLPLLLPLASLISPLVLALTNLLLYPLEEALRRYYLRDAASKLRRLGPTVVAVAGSYGKTSTKEFIATILSARYEVLKPPGSYNTPMGLSRVIREQLTPAHEIFVAELGDWVPGDIALLSRLLRPRVGVLTTIGPEHLERFKTMERVVASKFELVEALPSNGVAVVNQDDGLVRGLGERTPRARVTRYGLEYPGAQVRARDVRTSRQGLEFVVEADGYGEAHFRVGVLGRHNVSNLLAAVATGLALGMGLDEIAQAARRIQPVEHRLQPIEAPGGILVIDDAFNSNPSGAAAALDVLGELGGGQRILVTPGMVELAEQEFEANRRFGQQAAQVCSTVIVVGHERAAPIVTGLRDQGFPETSLHVVGDLSEARVRLESLVRPGDVVLFENDLPDTYADAESSRSRLLHQVSLVPGENGRVSAPRIPGLKRAFLDPGDGAPRLAYRDVGTSNGRPPVVLLHGWGASIDSVVPIQDCLAAERRVIAFDLPGFGQSEPPPEPWDSHDFAALIKRALDRLGLERVCLIGHSRGGAVAIVLAARWSELVERVILVNSAGIRPRRSIGYRARVAAYKSARRLAGRGPLRDWLSSRFGSTDYRAAGPLRVTLVRVVNEDLRALLPRVSAPCLLIWGDQDRETPLSNGVIMEQKIPDAGLVVFPGAGHFSYLDDLPRFCQIVKYFLAGDGGN